MKQIAIGIAITMALGTSAAQAAYTPVVTTTGNNFTANTAGDSLVGGANDLTFTWDGSFRTSVVTDGSYNATLSSSTKFMGVSWTTHNLNIYAPGTYTFYSSCPTGNPSCGAGAAYNMTVGAGQVGAHMLFDWRSTTNSDIVILWGMNKSWAQTGTTSAFSLGGSNPNGNTMNTVWNGVSIDTNMDTDNYSGTPMLDGPFMGLSFNFSVNGIHAVPISAAVPVPAAVWLLGSGLMGLASIARKRKKLG